MNLRFTLIFFLLVCQFCARAQNWQSVGSPLTWQVRYLYADTVNDKLLASSAVASNLRFLEYSDTTDWDTLGELGGGIYSAINYRGNIYTVSCPAPAGPHTSVGELVGSQWQPFAETRQNAFGLYQHDTDLYAMGTFDSIGGIQANQIARYDGSNWYPIGTATFGGGSAVTCAIHYQGDLYIGGGFHDTVGNCLAKWDGQNWTGFGSFFGGGIDAINCMTVYNGELYVGGYFTTSGGSPGDFIARYDGSTWTQVGGGMAGGQVFDMQVYNGKLWVCGQFSSAGGVPAVGLATYDGLDWCNVGIFDNALMSLEVFNGELYAGGAFWTIDGDSIAYIAKWIGGNNTNACGHLNTSIQESSTELQIKVFPNPANTDVTFSFEKSSQRTILLLDAQGREVLRQESDENQIEIYVGDLAPGIYIYQIQIGQNPICRNKLIVE